jgi:hypothetical protein
MKPRDINACCEQSIENPQRAWTCFSLVVYLLTGWICWFVFLLFILFDFFKTSQGKIFKRYRVCYFNISYVCSLWQDFSIHWYHNILPCDFDLEVWPTFLKFNIGHVLWMVSDRAFVLYEIHTHMSMFLVTRPFYWDLNFWPRDLDHWVWWWWPLLECVSYGGICVSLAHLVKSCCTTFCLINEFRWL